MTDPLLDDVKALLNMDFEDDRILKQIRRACENNEIISNYERNYVRELAERHLGKKPEFAQSRTVEPAPVIPDVILPQMRPTLEQSHKKRSRKSRLVPKSSLFNSKKKKLVLGIGVLILLIAITVALSADTFNILDDDPPPIKFSPFLSIQTDLTSYARQDLISISGTSNVLGIIKLSILNQNNELVWSEDVTSKSNSNFSTLAIAGGPGWESSGIYTIKADNGREAKVGTFSFTA